MADFNPKLTKVSLKPDKDGGNPTIIIQLETEYSSDLLGLVPLVGRRVQVDITTMQLGLPQMEVTHR